MWFKHSFGFNELFWLSEKWIALSQVIRGKGNQNRSRNMKYVFKIFSQDLKVFNFNTKPGISHVGFCWWYHIFIRNRYHGLSLARGTMVDFVTIDYFKRVRTKHYLATGTNICCLLHVLSWPLSTTSFQDLRLRLTSTCQCASFLECDLTLDTSESGGSPTDSMLWRPERI